MPPVVVVEPVAFEPDFAQANTDKARDNKIPECDKPFICKRSILNKVKPGLLRRGGANRYKRGQECFVTLSRQHPISSSSLSTTSGRSGCAVFSIALAMVDRVVIPIEAAVP